MSVHFKWNQVSLDLKQALGLDVWNAWFAQLVPEISETGSLVLVAPNDFMMQWMSSNYGDTLRRFNLSLRVGKTIEREVPETSQFNKDMTFQNFVVGPSNRFAYEVVKGLDSDGPAPYTPLFINGQAGVGKTHLLHAIGQKLVSRGLKVEYLSSDQFLRNFVRAVQSRDVESFIEGLVRSDVLLFDDFQFLIGKEQTQQQFFVVLNAVIDAGKRMVITADQLPNEFIQLHERMRSRLASGMTVTVHPPDYELRIALFQAWDPSLSYETVQTLAELKVSIRELRGALTRLKVNATYSQTEITPDFVKKILCDVIKKRATPPTLDEVIFEVLSFAQEKGIQVTREKLRSSGRLATVAEMRHIFMYISYELTGVTPAEIGRYLGDRNRTTVRHGILKVKEALAAKHEPTLYAVSVIKDRLGC